MSSSFDKVRRKNGSFYAGDIRLDPFETIRVVGEAEGVKDGLEFTVPGKEGGTVLVKHRLVTFM